MAAAGVGAAEAARAALKCGDLRSSQQLAATLVAERPDLAEGHFLLGISEADAGRIQNGIGHLSRAISIDPQGEYQAQLAKLYALVRCDAQASATLRAAEAAPPVDALSRDTMGCVYARLGDHPAALPHFSEAVRLEPDNPDYRYNLAVTLNFMGRMEEAEAALEALIALAPDEARAHHLLASLRKQTSADNHIDRLGQTRARAQDGRSRLLLGYALAKELEDVGREGEALHGLIAANAEHRRNLNYNFARDAAAFDAVEQSWSALAPSSADNCPDDAPIFVIGMPRTGTTLIDRIIGSHPDVENAGELQAFPLAVKRAAGTRTATVLDPETLLAAARADPGAIGRDYLQRALNHRRNPDLRFTDKFPGNFQYAGFIARALPNARIVCVRRNPMDTVLSNFRNLFAISSRYYDYSYDLLDIAAYYVRFDRLIALWRASFPDRLLELRYEDLIADQVGQTRRLLEHCGLPWSDDCLSFHTNQAPVSTPSAAQVRNPIYSRSVERWKRHADTLEPVRTYLASAGIAIP